MSEANSYEERLPGMLPEMNQIGPSLRPGWQRPTAGLVRTYLNELKEGIAPPSASHLYQVAMEITEETARRTPDIRRGIDLLESYVNPNSPSTLDAVGMAYPQLEQAARTSVRILAVNIGMPDLKQTSRQTTTRTFFNPVIEPIRSEGVVERVEACFSVPGVGVAVKRWKAVLVTLPGQKAFRLDEVDAWIMQHEGDHLDGKTCAHLSLEQGRKLFYAPEREHRRMLSRATDRSNWPLFPVEQWQAMMSGDFDLRDYARYLQ